LRSYRERAFLAFGENCNLNVRGVRKTPVCHAEQVGPLLSAECRIAILTVRNLSFLPKSRVLPFTPPNSIISWKSILTVTTTIQELLFAILWGASGTITICLSRMHECKVIYAGEVGSFTYEGDGYIKKYNEQELDEDVDVIYKRYGI